jgi:peptidoglycan/LPS O-acetylase OafA/YrhL
MSENSAKISNIPYPKLEVQELPLMRRHIPQLDGLRAVAALLVFLHHVTPIWAQNGWLGVDIFFALSGWLITNLLTSEWVANKAINYHNFYKRRIARLFPALLCAVLVGSLLQITLTQRAVLEVVLTAITALCYSSNWAMGWADDIGRLGITWSLAIEEQFYLIWPLALTALQRYSLRARILVLFTAVILVTINCAYLFNSAGYWRAYCGTDTHTQAILLGCLFAIAGVKSRPLLGKIVLCLFLVMAFLPSFMTTADMFYGGFAVVGLMSAILVSALAHTDRGWVIHLLASKPMVYIGQRSYGLYLWHFILLDLLERCVSLAGSGGILMFSLCVWIVTELSFRLIERPIRRACTVPS